jgi:nucleoside-diphosphate-sugar epimerase
MAHSSARGDGFDHDVETCVVTGATGDVGSWVVDRLAGEGIEVVGVDLAEPEGELANAEFHAVDLRDVGPTRRVIREADPDAVVHFAAISDPIEEPGTRVFQNNVDSTFTVLTAAGEVGAEVVWTSSQAVLGILFAREPWVPDALPVGETHECRPEDPYGTSKLCGEDIAGMVARRYEVPVTSIRPATIYAPDEYRARPKHQEYDLSSGALSGNLWSYVDVRDVARMVEAALAAEYGGHERFFCVADENSLGHPTTELIEAAAGELPTACTLTGTDSALSNAKAREVLGWEPAHSWREAADADVPELEWL